jgi:positive regulator of sigma E activity
MASRTSVERAPSVPRAGWRATPLLSPITIGIVLVVILLVAYVIGSLINDRNAARSIAVFAIGVVSFLGILSLSHRDTAGTAYDSGQVRVAVTTAFMMVYFAALGIFLFSTNTVGEFGRNLMENLTSLFGVIMGFYFAASAVEAYSRSREATARMKIEAGAAAVPGPTDVATPSPDTSALEQEVSDLREMVAGLLAERAEPAPPQPPSAS